MNIRALVALLALTTSACLPAPASPVQPNTGNQDAGPTDTGRPDTGTPDTGAPDTGEADAGEEDAGDACTPAPAVEWCAEQGRCDAIEDEFCTALSCPLNTCTSAEECVSTVCECVEENIRAVCDERAAECGTLPIRCGANDGIECGTCEGYDSCQDNACGVLTLVAPTDFEDEAGFTLGDAMAFGYDTLLVGSPGIDRVFVVPFADGQWGEDVCSEQDEETVCDTPVELEDIGEALLSSSGNPASFGAAIAIDGNTMVIGSPTESHARSRVSGGVRIYRYSNGRWVPRDIDMGANGASNKLVSARSGTSPVQLGSVVAVQGSLVAASDPSYQRSEDLTGILSGHLSMWTLLGNGATIQATRVEGVDPFDTNPSLIGSEFGSAIVITEDNVFVGAPRSATAFNEVCGSVEVFKRVDTDISYEQASSIRLDGCNSLNSADEFIRFGASLAFEDDQLFVVAPNQTIPNAGVKGAIHVYNLTPTATGLDSTLVTTLIPPTNRGFDGDAPPSIERIGRYLVVGTPYANGSGAAGKGGVFVYERSADGQWDPNPRTWQPMSLTGADAALGSALATDGERAFVSAPLGGQPGSGSANRPRGTIFGLDLTR